MRHLLTPGIRAEVTMIMGEEGQINIWHAKLDPEENPSKIFGALLMRWLAMLSAIGVTLDFTDETGKVIPLVRPNMVAHERHT